MISKCFLDSFEYIFFTAINIALMIPDDITLTIDYKNMWNIVYTELTLELTIGIKENFIFPALALYKRFNFLFVLSFINAHGIYFNTGFFLPVIIDFGDGFKFTLAWFAPKCKKADDKRLTVIVELGCINSFSIKVLKSNRRKGCISSERSESQSGGNP